MKKIADTGLLKAALDRDDQHHQWGRMQLQKEAPFYVCEAVLDEVGFLLGDPSAGVRLVARGDLILGFDLKANVDAVLGLLEKYADQPMDLADACIVRMTELSLRCKVWTTDRQDFQLYRRHGRQAIPCEFPSA
jgi:predicted nucleic acid-binding protein